MLKAAITTNTFFLTLNTSTRKPHQQTPSTHQDFTVFCAQRYTSNAFTIIELLLSMSFLGVLISIAVPSIQSFTTKAEITTTAHKLHSTLKHARNHALNNQVMVIVCQADQDNPSACHPKRKQYANWQSGWISYADLNENNELDDSDHVIASHQTHIQSGVIFNQTGRLRFFPRGSARSAGFYFCNTESQHTQYIRLLHTGRSRISRRLTPQQLSKCQNQLKS